MCSPNGDEKSPCKVQTTQISFSSKNTGRPEAVAATRRASSRSSRGKARYGSAMIYKRLADGSRHPRGERRPKRDEFLQSRGRQLVFERRQRFRRAALSQPRKSAHRFACNRLRREQHPLWSMFHLDDLRAELEPSVP